MADRRNPYERAFEAYLRALAVPYVAVDEARRARIAAGETLKNLDFIVATGSHGGWLVDVKGRRFPTGRLHPQYWKNWSFVDDLRSLEQWEQFFGAGFRGLLVFAYKVVGDRSPTAPEFEFFFESERYAFLATPLREYGRWARELSPRWGTVMVPVKIFREIARPFCEYLPARKLAHFPAPPGAGNETQGGQNVFPAAAVTS
ncbi:MAG: HYExAFE family protein [Thermoguttaceae bacterium]|nr:HYExAFE family protein [Thermoguttaceae bacterium]MDW8079747.1 HYExAFE family protein [Thermoguttaceae bacterium]